MKKIFVVGPLLLSVSLGALIEEPQDWQKERAQHISGLVNRTLHAILPPAGKAIKSFKPETVDFANWDKAFGEAKDYVRKYENKQLMLDEDGFFQTITWYNTYLKSLYTRGRMLGAGADLYTRMDKELAQLSERLDAKERDATEQKYPESVLSAVRSAQLLVRALQTANTQIMAYYDARGVDQTLAAMKPLVKDEKQQPERPLLSTDSQKRYEQLSKQIQEPSLTVFDSAQFNKVFMDVYQFAEEYGKEANVDQAEGLRRVLTTIRAKGPVLSEEERLQLETDIRGAWLRAREKKNKIDQKWFGSRAKAQAYELYALLWNKVLEGFKKQKPAGNV